MPCYALGVPPVGVGPGAAVGPPLFQRDGPPGLKVGLAGAQAGDGLLELLLPVGQRVFEEAAEDGLGGEGDVITPLRLKPCGYLGLPRVAGVQLCAASRVFHPGHVIPGPLDECRYDSVSLLWLLMPSDLREVRVSRSCTIRVQSPVAGR